MNKISNGPRTVWFVETRDPHSNECVSRLLEENGVENEQRDLLCYDGVRRNLWECPNHMFVANIERAARQVNLEIRLWRRVGKGSIKPWIFSSLACRESRLSKRTRADVQLHQVIINKFCSQR